MISFISSISLSFLKQYTNGKYSIVSKMYSYEGRDVGLCHTQLFTENGILLNIIE